MALSPEEIEQIARLARLRLTADERDRLAAELGQILEHFELLGEVDTNGVEPMTHAVDVALRLRADEVGESLDPGEALGGAPSVVDGCFRVPSSIAPAE